MVKTEFVLAKSLPASHLGCLSRQCFEVLSRWCCSTSGFLVKKRQPVVAGYKLAGLDASKVGIESLPGLNKYLTDC